MIQLCIRLSILSLSLPLSYLIYIFFAYISFPRGFSLPLIPSRYSIIGIYISQHVYM